MQMDNAVAFWILVHRITSYNVCYTKLLRNLLKTGDHVEHNAFGRGVVIRVDDDIATIAFAMPHGIKKILESHPSIKKVHK